MSSLRLRGCAVTVAMQQRAKRDRASWTIRRGHRFCRYAGPGLDPGLQHPCWKQPSTVSTHGGVSRRDREEYAYSITPRRRSQRHRWPWAQMQVHLKRTIPKARVLHPWPEARLHVRHSRREPGRVRSARRDLWLPYSLICFVSRICLEATGCDGVTRGGLGQIRFKSGS
jgi:hypothetical protein